VIEYIRQSDEWDSPDTPTEETLKPVVCLIDTEACAIWDSDAGTETHVVSTIYSDLQAER